MFIRHYKHRVAIRMLSSDQVINFPSWVLIESPRIVSTGICDIAVVVTPMNDEIDPHFSEGRMPFHSFERALGQLNDLLPLNQKQPFLIIGFSQLESTIDVLEMLPSGVENIVERVIEFPRDLYQAGVGVLSYFGEVLKQKHPDIKAKVRIEQDGNIVRMTIDAPDGTKEVIEKTLQDFALVVTYQAPPETLLDTKLQVHALTSKLMMAEMEVRQVRDLMRISESYQGERIQSLEQDVQFLREQIGCQIRAIGTSHRLLSEQSAKEERLIMAHIDSSRRTVDELVADAWDSAEVKSALMAIKLSLESSTPPDREKVSEALTTVRRLSPDTFIDLTEAVKGTLYGVSGNTVFLCLQQVAKLFG
ncbi:hypothetical protein I4436_09915 [Pseudomonas qingdaonensis]|uniref:hypothetical protein n=1 Tax=Pseudomonas qingdaonensis TaxID=2056231 RepID=UPI0018C8E466|nr:hypothetical protein [Pseudomonas qingdaonensis]MBG8559924.1 hypothetical protein [Pseudomonas qingdaonensis]